MSFMAKFILCRRHTQRHQQSLMRKWRQNRSIIYLLLLFPRKEKFSGGGHFSWYTNTDINLKKNAIISIHQEVKKYAEKPMKLKKKITNRNSILIIEKREKKSNYIVKILTQRIILIAVPGPMIYVVKKWSHWLWEFAFPVLLKLRRILFYEICWQPDIEQNDAYSTSKRLL